MKLVKAIRARRSLRLALVGAGGKTTAMFQLAHQMESPVLVSVSTHLGKEQARLADAHFILIPPVKAAELKSRLVDGVNLFTGPVIEDNRINGLAEIELEMLHQLADELACPLLVEADGSRKLPLKAPAGYEPPVPPWVNTVAVVVGLSGLGIPLTANTVHRAERFAAVSGAEMGKPVTMLSIVRTLMHPLGGLKNIPTGARKVVIFNQADTPALQAEATRAVQELWRCYESVLIASLGQSDGLVHAAHEPTAGIVLAGGSSQRLGQPKALLEWKGQPFIRTIVQTGLAAGLSFLTVIAGSVVEPIRKVLEDLPVKVIENPDWQAGQSSSIRAGIEALPGQVGSLVFLLCDQPHIPALLVRSLVEKHSQTLAPVISPLVDGKRANPVLFDRDTFADLLRLQGDVGGRAIFSKYPPVWLPWYDSSITLDVDTPEDYQRLLEIG
ncbi:MAG: selenium cofactor biosynthesis protein YqeC [Anaerolineaceae bacterium]